MTDYSSKEYGKQSLLEAFREIGNLELEKLAAQGKSLSPKDKAKQINKVIKNYSQRIVDGYPVSESDNTVADQQLSDLLMIHYTSFVVMLEYRNRVWPYDYMAFSRRIGELWEPFCKLPFEFPTKKLVIYDPPTFSHVQNRIIEDFNIYVDNLGIDHEVKSTIMSKYGHVWDFVASGSVNLKLDLHFSQNDTQYAIDYKSGFSSNEKGNTNRLLMVASIYQRLPNNYSTLMFIRQEESMNNNYLQKLRNSGLWEIYFAHEVYEKTEEFTGFDIGGWMNSNMNWQEDISLDFRKYLELNGIEKYLTW